MTRNKDALERFRKKLKAYISKNYETTEEFCWENQLPKSTISSFLSKKYDPKVSTLSKIAEAMGKEIFIDIK